MSSGAKMYQLSDSAAIAGVDCDFKKVILDRFRENDIGEICRIDLVTILFEKKNNGQSL